MFITLLTDFGYEDPYVASMKGVILRINPRVSIIDITHNVKKFDVVGGSLILKAAYKYFPKGTIHVAVVDPGVGGPRRPIIIRTRSYYFVGPDNGVLSLAAKEDGIESVYEINMRSRYLSHPISYTFHGRDVFAPVAGYLSLGVDVSELGFKVEGINSIDLPTPTIDGDRIRGAVIYIDGFGNLITNVPADLVKEGLLRFGEAYSVDVGGTRVCAKLVKAYSEVGEGEPLLIPNSFDLIELAVYKGNASRKLGVDEAGVQITIYLSS